MVLMPGGDGDELEPKIEGMRAAVAKAGGMTPEPTALSLSVGVARFPEDGVDAEELLAEADRRMYKSKRLHKKERPVTRILALAAEIREIEPPVVTVGTP